MSQKRSTALTENTRTLRVDLLIAAAVVTVIFFVTLWFLGQMFDEDKIVTPAYTTVFLLITGIVFFIDVWTISALVAKESTGARLNWLAKFKRWFSELRLALPIVCATGSFAIALYTWFF